jgi:16S rRNA (uracil1498-N3)-methyltransferase
MHSSFTETWFHTSVPEGARSIVLPDEEARHATKVLRLKPGTEIVITTGEGSVYKAALKDDRGAAEILGLMRRDPEPPGWALGLPLLRGRDTELPAEGACEFALGDIFLLVTDHSSEFKGQDFTKLVERLRQKSVVALKQAKKSWLTRIHAPQDLRAWRAAHAPIPLLVAHPGDDETPAPLPVALHLLTGPEGGFSVKELEWLFSGDGAGAKRLPLGPTRLRAIHAPVAALGSLTGRSGK